MIHNNNKKISMNNENDQSRVCYLFIFKEKKTHVILVATNNVRKLHMFHLFQYENIPNSFYVPKMTDSQAAGFVNINRNMSVAEVKDSLSKWL
jgi:hypothetical protein